MPNCFTIGILISFFRVFFRMDSKYSIFDIMGPVMVGPSSSHTAGALKIGSKVKALAGAGIRSAHIVLYNSFADTGEGHGTNLAIVAGLLGLDTFSHEIKFSHNIAHVNGMTIDIEKEHDESKHPNSALIIIEKFSGEMIAGFGESLGGGIITFNEIKIAKVSE